MTSNETTNEGAKTMDVTIHLDRLVARMISWMDSHFVSHQVQAVADRVAVLKSEGFAFDTSLAIAIREAAAKYKLSPKF